MPFNDYYAIIISFLPIQLLSIYKTIVFIDDYTDKI